MKNISYVYWCCKLDIMTTSLFADSYIKVPPLDNIVFISCHLNKCEVINVLHQGTVWRNYTKGWDS